MPLFHLEIRSFLEPIKLFRTSKSKGILIRQKRCESDPKSGSVWINDRAEKKVLNNTKYFVHVVPEHGVACEGVG